MLSGDAFRSDPWNGLAYTEIDPYNNVSIG